MADSVIKIVSQYHDMSSEPIKKSFATIGAAAVDVEKHFASMAKYIKSSMAYNRKAIVEAMKESGKSMRDTATHTRYMGASIEGIVKSFGALRNQILVYMFMVRPLIDLIKSTAQAAMEEEDSIKRLNSAMGLQGTQSVTMSAQLKKLAIGFMDTTRYGDEAIMQVFEKLITMGNVMPSQLGNITQAVLDLSAATGRDLMSSAELMAKASQGISSGLNRAGIRIDEMVPRGRLLGEVLKYINEHMGGRAQQDIESYAGKLKQLGNTFGELKETIGKNLLETWLGKDALWKLNDFFKVINEGANMSSWANLKKLRVELIQIDKTLEGPARWKKYFKESQDAWESQMKKRTAIIWEIHKEELRIQKQATDDSKNLDESARKEQNAKTLLDAEDQFRNLSSQKTVYERQLLEEDIARFREAGYNKEKLEIMYQERMAEIRKKDKSLEKTMEQYRMLEQITKNSAIGMRDTIRDVLVDGAKTGFKNLGDIVASFGDLLLKEVMEMIATTMLLKTNIDWVWKALGFAGGIAGGMGGGSTITGGVGGTTTQTAQFGTTWSPSFHSGGEVKATLLEGEGVLNRRAMNNLGVDNLDRLNRGESSGGGQVINNYYIQTIDERSFTDRLKQHGDIYANANSQGIKNNNAIRSDIQRYAS